MRHSLLLLLLLLLLPTIHADDAIRVVVWDEQQPAQEKAYENFLGNATAEHLTAIAVPSIDHVSSQLPASFIR